MPQLKKYMNYSDMCRLYNKVTGNQMPVSLYIEINQRVMDSILKLMMETGFDYKMPYGLGNIAIYRKDYYRLSRDKSRVINYPSYIDWVETAKQGKVTYYNNYHTDGIQYFFKWLRPMDIKVKHSVKCYSFKLSRVLKKKFGEIILSGQLTFNNFPLLRRCNLT